MLESVLRPVPSRFMRYTPLPGRTATNTPGGTILARDVSRAVPNRTSIAARPSVVAVTCPDAVTVTSALIDANVTESTDSEFPPRSVTWTPMSHPAPFDTTVSVSYTHLTL